VRLERPGLVPQPAFKAGHPWQPHGGKVRLLRRSASQAPSGPTLAPGNITVMADGSGDRRTRLRALPSVERLATAVARAELAERRIELLDGATDEPDLVERARSRLRPSLRRVLNATGVVVHTNLGRAPLAAGARAAVAAAAEGYLNLELDLTSGARGSRHDHVAALLCELTGARAAIAVNNCAAATLLCVSALARPGREVIVSRGQLVEIGGGFRIPEVIEQSGASLVEVGTTNRTTLADYAAAIGPDTAAILRVHPSNFRTRGFVASVEVEDVCSLGVPVIDDAGSGALAEELELIRDEPSIRRSVAAGSTLTCFSGDKLLGGPQAGIIVGRTEAVAACAAHPLARAVRVDKLSLAALEATLALYRDPQHARTAIPVLAMLDADPAELAERAERLAAATGGSVVESSARVGGGALPLLELRGPAVALHSDDADALASALRAGDPAIVGRIESGRVLLDVRTLAASELELAAAAVNAALGGR
jgi:L-seryl-tRNA(Ser) seleniumtransferase